MRKTAIMLFGIYAFGGAQGPSTTHVKSAQTLHPGADGSRKSPHVVFVEYGTDKAISTARMKKPLEACGISTETVKFNELASINDEGEVRGLLQKIRPELKRRSLPADSYFVLSAHGATLGFLSRSDAEGFNAKNPKNPIVPRFMRESATKLILGDEIVKLFHEVAPNSKVWVDSCLSGACQANTGSIATACKKNEMCSTMSQGWYDLADLLCDSREECRLFNELDKNHDGDLDAPELEAYLYAGVSSDFDDMLNESRDEVERWIAGKVRQCEQKPLSNLIGGEIQLRYELSYVLPGLASKTRFTQAVDFADAPAQQRYLDARPAWPVECRRGRRDCRLEYKGLSSWTSCRVRDPGFRRVFSRYAGNPEMRTFKIASDFCKRKWEQLAKEKN